MRTYNPDKWVVVELTFKGEPIKKVLASWRGGYLDGDSWKLSSGIEETKNLNDRYEFLNNSGSIYICHKGYYGMTMYTQSVYEGWKKSESDDIKIRILDESEFT